MLTIPLQPPARDENSDLPPILFQVRSIPIECFGEKHGRQTRKFLLMDIASYADANGDNCFPGISRLAKDCGLHQRSIQRNIAWLRNHGLVDVAIKGAPNQSNMYTILIPEVVTFSRRGDIQPSSRREAHEVVTSRCQEGGDGKRTGGDIQTPPNHQIDLPTTNRRPTKARAPKNGATPFVLPDWIPVEPWNGWVEMRVKMRKPLSDYAKQLAVKQLEKMREAGESPEEVLNRSIVGSYQGLYPKKDQGSRKPPVPQKISDIDHAKSFGLEPGQNVGRLR